MRGLRIRAVLVAFTATLCVSGGAAFAESEPPLSREVSAREIADDLVKAEAASAQYRIEEAVALYTRLIDSNNLSPAALAAVYLRRGTARNNYAMAYNLGDDALILVLRDFQKAGRLCPSANAFIAEGNALVALGAYADATAAFMKARELEQPDPLAALISLARVERILGHYDAALAYIDESFRLHGEASATMPMYYHRGWILRLQGRFAEAIDAFSKGLPKQPTYHAAYYQRACAHVELGEFDMAIADAKQALDLMDHPRSAEVKAWRETPFGKAYYQDLAANVSTIEAMAEGKASEAERASLCAATGKYGESLRSTSPLLRL